MQEIVSQADYYGLPEEPRTPPPPPEKMAQQLTPPTPWERPLRAVDE